MKKIKKIFTTIISMVLVIAMVGTSCVFADSTSSQDIDPGLVVLDHTSIRKASVQDENNNKKYLVSETAFVNSSGKTNYIGSLLEFCNQNGETVTINNPAGDIESTLYVANGLSELIPMCPGDHAISDIEMLNSHLYIIYRASDGMEVTLCYSTSGLMNYMVYDPAMDSAFINDGKQSTINEGVRAGVTFEMSDELEEQINDYLDEGDIDSIRNIVGISVIEDESGISIEPDMQILAPQVIPGTNGTGNGSGMMYVHGNGVDYFTTNAEMLADLKADWPTYTNTTKLTTTKYCDELNRYVSVKVTESRDTYTKKTANWGSWAVNTLVSVIATALGLASGTGGIAIASAILSAAGVGISTIDTITSAAYLGKSAAYTYHGARTGYVWDYTQYNNYVKVANYTGNGEFHGGYTSNGTWAWIHYTESFAYSIAYASVANAAIGAYNGDLMDHAVTSFMP